jgi:hypothetical protein
MGIVSNEGMENAKLGVFIIQDNPDEISVYFMINVELKNPDVVILVVDKPFRVTEYSDKDSIHKTLYDTFEFYNDKLSVVEQIFPRLEVDGIPTPNEQVNSHIMDFCCWSSFMEKNPRIFRKSYADLETLFKKYSPSSTLIVLELKSGHSQALIRLTYKISMLPMSVPSETSMLFAKKSIQIPTSIHNLKYTRSRILCVVDQKFLKTSTIDFLNDLYTPQEMFWTPIDDKFPNPEDFGLVHPGHIKRFNDNIASYMQKYAEVKVCRSPYGLTFMDWNECMGEPSLFIKINHKLGEKSQNLMLTVS